jgi:hypothetical protein
MKGVCTLESYQLPERSHAGKLSVNLQILVADTPRSPGYGPRAGYVVFVVKKKVALGLVFLRVFLFSL